MSIVNNSNNVYETYYKSDIFNQNKGVFSTREKYNPIQYTLKYSDVCKYKDPTYQYNPDVHYLRSQFNKEQNESYRYLLQAESREVNRQRNRIRKNAEIVYEHKLYNGNSTALAKRTNDFVLLEKLCTKY